MIGFLRACRGSHDSRRHQRLAASGIHKRTGSTSFLQYVWAGCGTKAISSSKSTCRAVSRSGHREERREPGSASSHEPSVFITAKDPGARSSQPSWFLISVTRASLTLALIAAGAGRYEVPRPADKLSPHSQGGHENRKRRLAETLRNAPACGRHPLPEAYWQS